MMEKAVDRIMAASCALVLIANWTFAGLADMPGAFRVDEPAWAATAAHCRVAVSPVSGRMLVLWEHLTEGDDETTLRARVVGPAGESLTGALTIGDEEAAGTIHAVVEGLSLGGFAIAWGNGQGQIWLTFLGEEGETRVSPVRVDRNAVPLSARIGMETGPQGRVLLTWTATEPDRWGMDYVAHLLNSDGHSIRFIRGRESTDETSPDGAFLEDGSFILVRQAWPGWYVWASRFGPDGKQQGHAWKVWEASNYGYVPPFVEATGTGEGQRLLFACSGYETTWASTAGETIAGVPGVGRSQFVSLDETGMHSADYSGVYAIGDGEATRILQTSSQTGCFVPGGGFAYVHGDPLDDHLGSPTLEITDQEFGSFLSVPIAAERALTPVAKSPVPVLHADGSKSVVYRSMTETGHEWVLAHFPPDDTRFGRWVLEGFGNAAQLHAAVVGDTSMLCLVGFRSGWRPEIRVVDAATSEILATRTLAESCSSLTVRTVGDGAWIVYCIGYSADAIKAVRIDQTGTLLDDPPLVLTVDTEPYTCRGLSFVGRQGGGVWLAWHQARDSDGTKRLLLQSVDAAGTVSGTTVLDDGIGTSCAPVSVLPHGDGVVVVASHPYRAHAADANGVPVGEPEMLPDEIEWIAGAGTLGGLPAVVATAHDGEVLQVFAQTFGHAGVHTIPLFEADQQMADIEVRATAANGDGLLVAASSVFPNLDRGTIYCGAVESLGAIRVSETAGNDGDGVVPFGAVARGLTKSETIRIENSGVDDLILADLRLERGLAFTVDVTEAPYGLTMVPITLRPGETAEVAVSFAPATHGSFTDRLIIETDGGPRSVTVPLNGTTTGMRFAGADYPAWYAGQLSSSGSDAEIAALRECGANAIAIVPTFYVDDRAGGDASTVFADATKTITRSDFLHACRKAHQAGLQIVYKPHVDPLSQSRTTFVPRNSELFFRTYREKVINHFRTEIEALAQEGIRIALFVIGTELQQLSGEDFRSQWEGVLADAREFHQDGPVTYAANANDDDLPREYETLCFWDLLDYVGIDWWFDLSEVAGPEPTRKSLTHAVEEICDPSLDGSLGAWLATRGDPKPVIITELGFRSISGAHSYPNRWSSNSTDDQQLQADCLAATFDTLSRQSWCEGVLLWLWYLERGDVLAVPGLDYSPQGKVAEQTVSFWWSSLVDDRDGDGLPDALQQTMADSDPSDDLVEPDDVLPAGDFDGDGRSNIEEYATYGTDPIVADWFQLGVVGGSPSGLYQDGEAVTVVANAAPVDREFDSWSVFPTAFSENLLDADVPTTQLVMPAGNIVLEATFDVIPLDVAFDLGEHGTRTGGGDLVQSVPCGAAAELPTVQAHAGWVFTGWIPPVPEAIVVPASFAAVYQSDVDNDGMADAWERDNELDSTSPADAEDDPDGDGLINVEEFRAGDDPWARRLPAGWSIVSTTANVPATWHADARVLSCWHWNNASHTYETSGEAGDVLYASQGYWLFLSETAELNISTGRLLNPSSRSGK